MRQTAGLRTVCHRVPPVDDDDDFEEVNALTEVHGRPLPRDVGPADRSPDAIFRSFVANAYEESAVIGGGAPAAAPDSETDVPTRTGRKPLKPVPSVNASLRNTEQWASSVEELLDADDGDGEPTEEPTRVAGVPAPTHPVAKLADDPEERRDTEPPPMPERKTPAEPIRRADVRLPKAPEEGTLRVVLLTKKKPGSASEPEPDARPSGAAGSLSWDAIDRGAVRVPDDPQARRPVTSEGLTREVQNPDWKSVVRPPSTTTQRREALKLVPDVASLAPPPTPLAEGSEDGMMPGGELDRKLGDMAVLLRYGHQEQVRRELDHLIAEYPRDLLLLRRISEFWVGHQRHALACEVLFTLASGLFERRNVEGMRQALEQVLVLSPGNERASRLLSLLAERPDPARR